MNSFGFLRLFLCLCLDNLGFIEASLIQFVNIPFFFFLARSGYTCAAYAAIPLLFSRFLGCFPPNRSRSGALPISLPLVGFFLNLSLPMQFICRLRSALPQSQMHKSEGRHGMFANGHAWSCLYIHICKDRNIHVSKPRCLGFCFCCYSHTNVTGTFIPPGISSTESGTLGPGKWCILTPWLNKGYLPSVNAFNFIEDLGASDSIEISCWIQHWGLVSRES